MNGTALLSSVVAGTLIVSSLAYYGKAVSGSASVGQRQQNTVLAEAFAAELLEYFISLDPAGLKAELAAIPLCKDINTLNAEGVIEYPDALAQINTAQTALNGAVRSYRIEVVDILNPSTLTTQSELCNTLVGNYALLPSERYLVTTKVSWLSRSGGRQLIPMSALVGAGGSP